jgi:23S rRNA pseudouridine1911/1915/1917 synthase
MVIDKPAGWPVQPDSSGSPSLLELAGLCRPKIRVWLVHRLDRPVSGLVVLAKTAAGQTSLTRQMTGKTFTKQYWAVVEPAPDQASGTCDNELIKNGRLNISRIALPGMPGAKRALMRYQVLERLADSCLGRALLEIELLTGRHHQIRVQLAHAGWPIVGDGKYGGLIQGEGHGERGRIALFARSIQFNHPSTGVCLSFTAQPPNIEPWLSFALVAQGLGQADGPVVQFDQSSGKE